MLGYTLPSAVTNEIPTEVSPKTYEISTGVYPGAGIAKKIQKIIIV